MLELAANKADREKVYKYKWHIKLSEDENEFKRKANKEFEVYIIE